MVTESHVGYFCELLYRISVVKEFCKISLDFIRKGVNRKVYQSAARKLRQCIIMFDCQLAFGM